jgi:hypothetical protein
MGNRNRNNRNRHQTKLSNTAGNIFGNPAASGGNKGGGGGYGLGNKSTTPASGTQPAVNPFIIPKASGLNTISQTFPNNYYVEWNLSTWRSACDQCIRMGYATSYAVLVSWAFECSPFIQSLFNKLGAALDKIPFYCVDSKGNQIPELTDELCGKLWHMQLRKEIMFSYFWGFTGLNFDPVLGKVYKYPMQDIDPINRFLKSNTFSFYDGVTFNDHDNLLFVQPSSNYESFLGWMQPITRAFIQMNLASNNWLAAGRRLAFPLLTMGYPQNDIAEDPLNPTQTVNPYKTQAEAIAANVDPTKAMLYPYTIDDKGNIVKSIEIDFEKPGTAANMHKIFQEFNADQKADIQEMIFGRSFTNTTSGSGNRALGEVEEKAVDQVMVAILPTVLAILNDDFKIKISKFYDNLPKDWKFGYNATKQLTITDIVALSGVVISSGYKFTAQFFEQNGLSKEFIEEAPVIAPPENKEFKPVKNSTFLVHPDEKKKYI